LDPLGQTVDPGVRRFFGRQSFLPHEVQDQLIEESLGRYTEKEPGKAKVAPPFERHASLTLHIKMSSERAALDALSCLVNDLHGVVGECRGFHQVVDIQTYPEQKG
jgi:hypothetical protein